MKNKVFLSNDDMSYYWPFDHLGLVPTTDAALLERRPEEFRLVVFTGGEDVSPELYGHRNTKSFTNPHRDMVELAAFETAEAAKIPMAGICRGAQFLCVMAGGSLIQDCDNHGNWHDVLTNTGERLFVSSTHHQMQYPWDLAATDYELVAWSPAPLCRSYLYDGRRIPVATADPQLQLEPDMVYYRNINALAAQFHPEYMRPGEKDGKLVDQPAVKFYRQALLKYLGGDIQYPRQARQ